MSVFLQLLGFKGMVALVGIMIFAFCYKYSVHIFDFIERQTLGTRTYILEKLELLFIDIAPERITYILLFLSVGIGGFTFLVLGALSKWGLGLFLGILLSFIGFKIPKPFVDYLVSRRVKLYQSQMVDALTLLSNGIRAGLSLPQSVGMVVDEMPEPISQEYNVILQQNKIGVPLEECFDNLAKRIPTEDNEMFVSSINILRESGGNLAEVFDTIVNVIRERVRLQQKVDTYTAQGMFQGMTIAAMPFAIGGIYAASDPQSMIRMFDSFLGIAIMIGALILDAVGFIIILKIVKIKM
ncbi:type II secretion system F family protein [Halobacteriovorax sp. GB3]|uniref:type II secretion system F family protein n=1 Tax=Halobacteriovorax sp. GB3 TaxID=2719615 RepID=UPI002361A433|nr:type II secretion system F family protein [Halobacteriovorax sp. GB3]MDD0854551.1 type II secretion system F family protein [Halobacteriovorax sp. GB3]